MSHKNYIQKPKEEELLGDLSFKNHKLKIFDAHTHLYLDSFDRFSKHKSTSTSLLNEMDRCGVEKALVISIAPQMDQDEIFRSIKAHPERLYLAGSVDPWSPTAIKSVHYAVEVLGARAIKLHPRLQGFGYKDIDLLMPIAKICGEIGVPLILCSFCGGRSLFNSRPIDLVHELASENPMTTIVMAHAGGHRPIDALLVQKACPNVYLEISFSPLYFSKSSIERDFQFMLERCDSKKLIFGSDYPEKSIQDSLEWLLDSSFMLKIGSEALENILYKNAIEVYKIK